MKLANRIKVGVAFGAIGLMVVVITYNIIVYGTSSAIW